MTFVQFLVSRWRLFISISAASFVAFALGVFLRFPADQVLIRSSVDTGSYLVGNAETPFYPTEQLVRRTLGVYVPMALSTISKEGASTKTLSALQNSGVENIGFSIAVTTIVDASAENEARKFQESLCDLIVSGEAPRVEALHEAVVAKVAGAKSYNYKQQANEIRDQIGSIGKRLAEIDNTHRDLQAELANQLQRLQPASQTEEQLSTQTRIRQLQDQIANQNTALANLPLQQDNLIATLVSEEQFIERQTEKVAEAQLQQKSFSEPRVSLSPTSILITPQWRRSGLLVVAFVASLLIAFGAITALYNIQAAKNRQN